MDYENVLVWKCDAGIQRRDPRVVPLLDLAEKDLGDYRTRKVEWTGQALHVIGHDIRTHDRRDVEDRPPFRLRQFFVRHRSVRSAEVHGAFDDLANPAARPD